MSYEIQPNEILFSYTLSRLRLRSSNATAPSSSSGREGAASATTAKAKTTTITAVIRWNSIFITQKSRFDRAIFNNCHLRKQSTRSASFCLENGSSLLFLCYYSCTLYGPRRSVIAKPENAQQRVRNAQVDCVSCSVSRVGEFCCASGVPASAEHAILVNRSGSTVEAFGDAQHERPLLHSPLAVLPSVNAASCGAVQRRYYLDFDDSRNDPPPSEWLGRTRSQRRSIRTQLLTGPRLATSIR